MVGPLFGQMSHVQMSAQIIFQLVHTDEQIHIYADPTASQIPNSTLVEEGFVRRECPGTRTINLPKRCGCATFGISHLGLCSHIPYLGTCSHLYIHPYHYHYHYTPTCPPVEVSRTSPYGDESGFVLSQCLAALPSVDPKSQSTAVDEHQPPPRIVNSFPCEKPPPRIINPFPRENLPIP